MSGPPEREGRGVARAAAWGALAYSLLMALPLLRGFAQGDGASAFGALVAATWSASPAYGAALCALASSTRAGASLFLGIELAIMAWFAFTLVDSAGSSTGGLIYFTLPVLQWGALILLAAAAALMGWRTREKWPDQPPADTPPPEAQR